MIIFYASYLVLKPNLLQTRFKDYLKMLIALDNAKL